MAEPRPLSRTHKNRERLRHISHIDTKRRCDAALGVGWTRMPVLKSIAHREALLSDIIGPQGARACVRRDALRLVCFTLGWLWFVPAIVWAQVTGGVLVWTITAVAATCVFGVFFASVMFGHRAVSNANSFVGGLLGYRVFLGSNMGAREWRSAIEREKRFHEQGYRPKFFIYRAPKDS